jgi:hypothetical protein
LYFGLILYINRIIAISGAKKPFSLGAIEAE